MGFERSKKERRTFLIICDITNLTKDERSFFDGTPAGRRIAVAPMTTLIGVSLGEHVIFLLRQKGLLIREVEQVDPAVPRKRLPHKNRAAAA
jgi:hypothetical protein